MTKIAYFDAPTGISGDMTLAALIDAGAQLTDIKEFMAALPMEPWDIKINTTVKNGIAAKTLDISFAETHHHRHLADIMDILDTAALPPVADKFAREAFTLLAAAEAKAHGIDVDQVHFHEVGANDAIIDICGVSCALFLLGVDSVYIGSLPLSTGFVDCAHGRLPVPVPAVLNLLAEYQFSSTRLTGELITPTGAAILAASKAIQTELPPFRLVATGLGAGTKDLSEPNILRVMIGETNCENQELGFDTVDVLRTYIDDATGEVLGDFWHTALVAGALDMVYTPILMKKGRPAYELTLIVKRGEAAYFAELIFAHTPAIGLRISHDERLLLPRRIISVDTPFGSVEVKVSGLEVSPAVINIAPEYESCAAASRRHNVPLKTVYNAAIANYKSQITNHK